MAASHDSEIRELRQMVFQSMHREAEGLYRQLLTIASSFLGGSLIFLTQMDIGVTRRALWLLFLSWVLFALSITLLLLVRWNNVEQMQQFLEALGMEEAGEKQRAEELYAGVQKRTRRGQVMTWLILLSLMSAMVLLGGFLAWNTWIRAVP